MYQPLKRIAAIHDLSCLGRGSLATVIPVLSAGGLNVCPLPTALLSNHTDERFKEFTFLDLTEELGKIITRWQTLSLSFDCIYTGFLGSARQIDIIMDFIGRFQTERTLVCIDPVMADNGRVYSSYTPDMIEGMKQLVKKAHIITPNLTEAFILLDVPYRPNPGMLMIKEMLLTLSEGKKQVVITGIPDGDEIGSAFIDPKTNKASFVTTKNLSSHFCGAGDLFTSLLLTALLFDTPLKQSVIQSAAFCQKAMEYTLSQNRPLHFGIEFEPFLHELNQMDCQNVKVKEILI